MASGMLRYAAVISSIALVGGFIWYKGVYQKHAEAAPPVAATSQQVTPAQNQRVMLSGSKDYTGTTFITGGKLSIVPAERQVLSGGTTKWGAVEVMPRPVKATEQQAMMSSSKAEVFEVVPPGKTTAAPTTSQPGPQPASEPDK